MLSYTYRFKYIMKTASFLKIERDNLVDGSDIFYLIILRELVIGIIWH